MAYLTGTATTPTDLLQQLVTFLSSNGWTANMSASVATGHWRAHLSRGAAYVNLYATVGNVGTWNPWPYSLFNSNQGNNAGQGYLTLYVGSAYNGANAWSAQGGGPTALGSPLGAALNLQASGLGIYHFFCDGDNVVVFAEKASGGGIFSSLCWGLLNAAGTLPGTQAGQFFGGGASSFGVLTNTGVAGNGGSSAFAPMSFSDGNSSCCSFVKADVDTGTGKWVYIGDKALGEFVGNNSTGRQGMSNQPGGQNPTSEIPTLLNMTNRTTSSATGQLTLLPIHLFALRDAAGYSLLGSVPNVFACNAWSKGYSSGQTFTIGADTYVVFRDCAIKKV